MAVTFNSIEAQRTLCDRKIMIIGDSNMRALYKDIVWLLNSDSFVDNTSLRTKLERSYMGDELMKKTSLTKSRDFTEDRLYRRNRQHVEFHFVTKCFCPLIEALMKDIREKRQEEPDVIIMNSTLWDLSRWGPDGVNQYKENLLRLMSLLVKTLSPKCLFIWVTALPIDSKIRGGLLVKQIEFLEQSLRFHLMEANLYAAKVVSATGYDVIDFHYHLHLQVARRCKDGVHMTPLPLRLLTNLTLTHLAITFDLVVPYHGDMILFNEELDLINQKRQDPKELLNSYIEMAIRSEQEKLVIREKLDLISQPDSPLPAGKAAYSNLDESGVYPLIREEDMEWSRKIKVEEKDHEEQPLCKKAKIEVCESGSLADTGAARTLISPAEEQNLDASVRLVNTFDRASTISIDSGFGDDDLHTLETSPAMTRHVHSTKPAETDPALFTIGVSSSQTTVSGRNCPRRHTKAKSKKPSKITYNQNSKAQMRRNTSYYPSGYHYDRDYYYDRSVTGYEFMLNSANYKFMDGYTPYNHVSFNAPFLNRQLDSRIVYWHTPPRTSYYQNDYY